MRYTAVSTTTGKPLQIAPGQPVPPDTKFVYIPRIKCLDCLKKIYTPGPGITTANFEVHLKYSRHRQRVEERKRTRRDVKAGMPAAERGEGS